MYLISTSAQLYNYNDKKFERSLLENESENFPSEMCTIQTKHIKFSYISQTLSKNISLFLFDVNCKYSSAHSVERLHSTICGIKWKTALK